MNDLSSFGTAEYSYPIKTVFLAARTAFALSNIYDLTINDEVGNRLVMESKASLSSWGESIAIEFSSTGAKGTFVRVTSSYKRAPGKAAKSGVNRNQKNVDFVLANISAEVARSTSPSVSVTAAKVPGSSSQASAEPTMSNPYDKPLSRPTLFALLGGAVVIIVAMISFSQGINASRQTAGPTTATSAPAEQSATPAPAATNSSTPKPTPTKSSPPQPTRTSAPATCFETETAVTMVRNVFSDASASPSQVSAILNEAARMWASDSVGASGSKKEWLQKMRELSLAVDSYLRTGTPADGATKFDQLFANMGLVNNFC